MTLLSLPKELIIQILSHLTHQALVACQLSSKALYITIKRSVLLQFRIALSIFKVTDNPSCHLSLSERFKALRDSEHAWTCLRKDFQQRITVNYGVSGIYDLSDGVFLLGNAAQTALHYVKLPSSVQDHVEWKKIEVNPNEGKIIDMGFCLHEHDLLAVVTRFNKLFLFSGFSFLYFP
jgi:F-box domain